MGENSFTTIFSVQNIIIYLLVINLITFLTMWIDKRKAQKSKWRISETALFTLALLGGSIGGMIGMYKFRHKTQKARFKYGFPIILVLEVALCFIYLR